MTLIFDLWPWRSPRLSVIRILVLCQSTNCGSNNASQLAYVDCLLTITYTQMMLQSTDLYHSWEIIYTDWVNTMIQKCIVELSNHKLWNMLLMLNAVCKVLSNVFFNSITAARTVINRSINKSILRAQTSANAKILTESDPRK